jgi:hypothetical protein
LRQKITSSFFHIIDNQSRNPKRQIQLKKYLAA